MNQELPDVEAGFQKAEELEIKLPISTGSSKKQENFRKTSTFALLNMPKPLTVWITANCGKLLTKWEYQPPDLPPEKSVCRSRSKLEPDMVPNWERSTSRLYIVTLLV